MNEQRPRACTATASPPSVLTARGDRAIAAQGRLPGCEATIDPQSAAATDWDALVIGAGPAGALAARQLARAGLRTLLVDKSSFPRDKVCGGCISRQGLKLLEIVGLGHLVDDFVSTRLSELVLAAGRRRVALPLPLGAAVSRRTFDASLVREAVSAGAAFLPETTAVVRGLAHRCQFRAVELHVSPRRVARARSRLVVVADGLGSTSVKRHGLFAPQTAPYSRVGLGATLWNFDVEPPPGSVLMSIGCGGYVGMVRISGGSVNIAAAVDPAVLRQKGPMRTVSEIWTEAGVEPPRGCEAADWRGTGLLTRRSSRVSSKRLLVLGDAAGYAEPFTGEGMTWAMLSAVSVAPVAADWIRRNCCDAIGPARQRAELAELAELWSAKHRRQISWRQRHCRVLAYFLRRPAAVRGALSVISLIPGIAAPFVRHFWNPSDGFDRGLNLTSGDVP